MFQSREQCDCYNDDCPKNEGWFIMGEVRRAGLQPRGVCRVFGLFEPGSLGLLHVQLNRPTVSSAQRSDEGEPPLIERFPRPRLPLMTVECDCEIMTLATRN